MSKLETFKKEARRAEEREDFVQAIELYGRAASEAKEDPSATFEVGLYNRIGDLYLKLEDSSQAVYHYLLAVDRYADDGLYPPAIALCRKVLRVAPDQVDAYRKLARLHEATGLMADAREEMDRYLAGVWEAGQVNGAMDGLPELVARLMSSAPDLEEVRRLTDEGESKEAFELLYRQWEDDSDHWESEDGNGNGARATREASAEEAAGGAGLPQTDPTDRGLGASLRRGWQGLFGDGANGEAADEPEATRAAQHEAAAAADAGAAEEADAEARKEDGAEASTLDHVDDMAWLQEVTASNRGVAAPPPAEEADEEDAGVEAAGATDGADEEDETELELEILGVAREEAPTREEPAAAAEEEAPAREEPTAGAEAPAPVEEPVEEDVELAPAEEAAPDEEIAASLEDAREAVEAEEDAEADADADADDTVEAEEPARLPDEVLVAAAESLSREARPRPALTGDVAAPMLLSAAGPEVPEGRTAVAERPLDRAVQARLHRRPGASRPGGRPPEGPAFETPGREDYLPAGGEVAARVPSPRMLWLSDQVALLGAIDRNEPLAVRPAYARPLDVLRSAAEDLERTATVEPVAALPADVAAPALLGAGVAEEAWVAEPVVEETPRPAVERRPPEGPEYETPGRDDYLPAGAEIGSRLPGAALSWLADAVEHLHRLEWGEPDWMEAAREAKGRAAAALADLAEDAPARPALPADLAGPRLLPAARVQAETGDAVDDTAVEEVPVAAGDLEIARPAAAAGRASAQAPDGPSYQTPGRDDYLPAGAEVADGLPSPALAWLAASVADIHRLDGDVPAWFDEAGGGVDAGRAAKEAEIRIEGFDGSEEAAARATRNALALIAAEQVASPAEPPADADGPDEEEVQAGATAADAEVADAGVAEVEDVEAEEAASEAVEAATPDADATDATEAADATDEAPTAATVDPAGRPSMPGRTPGDAPDVTPPVEKPASRPNGLDFTALLKRIGWLRGQQETPATENGSAGGETSAGGAADAVRSGSDDAVMPPWARGSSSEDSEDSEGTGGRNGGASGEVQPPTVGAPGSGVPDFTDLLQKVGWLEQDERT